MAVFFKFKFEDNSSGVESNRVHHAHTPIKNRLSTREIVYVVVGIFHTTIHTLKKYLIPCAKSKSG